MVLDPQTVLGPPRIRIRRLTAADTERIHKAFHRLSPCSLYWRFGHSRIEAATALDWVARLDADAGTHVALGACDPVSGDLIGVARYVRTSEVAAELAVAIIDVWQGRGVGSLLLNELVRIAPRGGIHELQAFVMPGNSAAVRLLRDLGATRDAGSGSGLLEYRLSLGPSGGEQAHQLVGGQLGVAAA